MVVVVGLMGYIHVVMLYAVTYGLRDFNRPLCSGLFLMLVLMGNVMGKVRRNFFIGVRTPWTLASERVWCDTHRLAAWLFVAVGLSGFALSLIGQWLVAVGLLVAVAFVLVLYSLV